MTQTPRVAGVRNPGEGLTRRARTMSVKTGGGGPSSGHGRQCPHETESFLVLECPENGQSCPAYICKLRRIGYRNGKAVNWENRRCRNVTTTSARGPPALIEMESRYDYLHVAMISRPMHTSEAVGRQLQPPGDASVLCVSMV